MTRFLFPLLIIVLSVVAFFSLGRPLIDEIGVLKTEKADLVAGEESLRQLLARQNELLNLYNQFSDEQIEQIDKFLPDNIDHVRLIIDINGIADRYNLKLSNIGIKSAEASADEGEASGEDLIDQDSVILSFSVTATYGLFKQLMDDLAQSLRLLDLTGLSFSATETGLYNYNVEVRTYWLP